MVLTAVWVAIFQGPFQARLLAALAALSPPLVVTEPATALVAPAAAHVVRRRTQSFSRTSPVVSVGVLRASLAPEAPAAASGPADASVSVGDVLAVVAG